MGSPDAAAQRLDQICGFLVWRILSMVAEATLRILPRSGSIAWVSRLRRLLGRAAGRIALDQEQSRYRAAIWRSNRPACRAGAGVWSAVLREHVLGLAAGAVFGAFDHEGEQIGGLAGSPARQWSKRSRNDASTSRVGFGAGELFLGLALELRLADEQRDFGGSGASDVLGGELAAPRLLPRISPQARRPFSRAARSRLSCVPPCGVGMVLQ